LNLLFRFAIDAENGAACPFDRSLVPLLASPALSYRLVFSRSVVCSIAAAAIFGPNMMLLAPVVFYPCWIDSVLRCTLHITPFQPCRSNKWDTLASSARSSA